MARAKLLEKENSGFLAKGIDGSVSKEFSAIDGIHLDYLSWLNGCRYPPPLFILFPLGTDNVFLGQNLIDFRNREMYPLSPSQGSTESSARSNHIHAL